MSGDTTTTLATFIDTDYQDEVVKTHYDETPFTNLVGKTPATKIGDSIDWTVNSAGHTAKNYSEGDTPPTAGSSTDTNLTLDYKYAWDVAQVSGHAIDALKGGRVEPVEMALNQAVAAVNYKQEQNMVASFIAALNDDTNYGGKARATYNLDSFVQAGGSGALTAAFLSAVYEALRISPRAKSMEGLAVMSSFEQVNAYTEIAGVAYNEKNFNWGSDSSTWDIGKIKPSIAYNGKPWFEIPTMTNTYVFFARLGDLEIIEKRPISFKMLGAVDDSDRVLVTSAMEFKCRDPYRCGRIEALTT